MFIVFEGTEGSGKTSLINLCYKWLISEGYPCLVSREPGGTALGEQLRNILLSSDSTPLAELLMFAADRAQHVKAFLKPKLAKGNIILCYTPNSGQSWETSTNTGNIARSSL